MIITILIILLYALVTVLVLELVFWIIGLFIAVPPRIRQIVYAIAGILFAIWVVQSLMTGGTMPHLPPLNRN